MRTMGRIILFELFELLKIETKLNKLIRESIEAIIMHFSFQFKSDACFEDSCSH